MVEKSDDRGEVKPLKPFALLASRNISNPAWAGKPKRATGN